MKKIILSSFLFFVFQGFSDSNESCEAEKEHLRRLHDITKANADILGLRIQNLLKEKAELRKDVELFKDGIESYKGKLEKAEEQAKLCTVRETPRVRLPIRPICRENPNLIACRNPRRPVPDEVIENTEPIENPAPNQVRDYCDEHPYARDCPHVGSQGVR